METETGGAQNQPDPASSSTAADSATRPRASAPAASKPKTAVIVIHGMGDQWPMDTLRGFVDAAWKYDGELSDDWSQGETYSKPERITGNFELRRITTRYWKTELEETEPPRRVDFFEFYWAYLMQGNTLGAVVSWLLRLLVRRPAQVPRRLLGGWIAGLVVLVAGFILTVLTVTKPDLTYFGVPTWLGAVFAAVGGGFSALWLRPVAGDAARYLSPSPGNVAARQAIREAGIDLLTKIQQTGDYDRIIVAGHSLGSVIGYDILHYAWGRLDTDALKAAHPAGSQSLDLLGKLEAAAAKLEEDPTSGVFLTEYRQFQSAYFQSLAAATNADGTPLWLVSDFVTMGSPLSSADVLLAKDRADLDERIAMRDQPSSPPQSEQSRPLRFSYPPAAKLRIPHHGAVFAPVVWTNIYVPHILGVFGDFVSGPVAPQLGPAVRDVRVPIGAPAFRHLDYWARPARDGAAIRALRHGLNLRARDESRLWGTLASAIPVPANELAGTGKKIEVQQ